MVGRMVEESDPRGDGDVSMFVTPVGTDSGAAGFKMLRVGAATVPPED